MQSVRVAAPASLLTAAAPPSPCVVLRSSARFHRQPARLADSRKRANKARRPQQLVRVIKIESAPTNHTGGERELVVFVRPCSDGHFSSAAAKPIYFNSCSCSCAGAASRTLPDDRHHDHHHAG
jgi:hypothetical protein